MKKTHIVRILALFVAALIVAGAVGRAAEGPVPFASRVRGLIANLIPVSTASAAGHVRATGERVTLRMAERQTPYLHLSNDAAALPTEYATGTGLQELAGGTQAHALASADFDEDGVPDLVGGYTGASGVLGVVTLQRGNVDAIYQNSPEARERRGSGEFTDAPFHSAAGAFIVPEAADFVGAGDFDADGHSDVVAARRGGNALYFLRGDGRGNLAGAERIELPGTLTALVTGEMNRRDGLTDIVVGIASDAGAAALVFESPAGALRGQHETLPLPATASGLALGALDADAAANDLAIAAGNELLIVHGRDRRLSMDESSRAGVPGAVVSRSVFESAVASIATGDFAGDAQQELAVLTTDGTVRVFERQSETNKTTEDASATAVRASEAMTLALAVAGTGTSPRRLLTAKVSALPKDDLLVFGGTNEVQIVTTRDPDVFDEAGTLATTGSARLSVAASLTSESEVTAVLPTRLNADALQDLVMVTKNGTAPSVVQTEAAATFVVNIEGNTNDKNPGDGVCADVADKCSFNTALQEANANAGADTIQFNIPGAGVHTLQNNRTVDEAVTIDGTTQPGGGIEIVSPFTGINAVTLFFGGGNSVLRGVAIHGNNTLIRLPSSGNIVEGNKIGIRADGTKPAGPVATIGIWFIGGGGNNLIGGTTAQARNIISNCNQAVNLGGGGAGNILRGNYIGTNVAGTTALPNNNVIDANTVPDITIGGTTAGAGNLISGNGFGAAVSITLVTTIIQGNLIGTTADGIQPLANGGIGIDVLSDKVVTIGGTTPAARNVIAASSIGILIRDFAGSNELMQGNFIGTNSTGTGALPNFSHGIELRGALNVTIGGTVPGAGNLISGNGDDGIRLNGGVNGVPGSAIIQGNLIGTDVNGVIAIPNTSDGIELISSIGTVIGGTSAEARNVVSGNRANGIRIGANASSGRIEGNYIGVNRFGTGALGNNGNGVFFDNFLTGNTVGGTANGASNTIAFNGGTGLASSTALLIAAVQANSIHDNGGLGIDLSSNGVTKNTPGSRSNFPVITSVDSSNTGTTIQGTLQNNNTTAGITYTLQFFSNLNVDPSGYGEGETFIGTTTIITNGTTSPRTFSLTVTPAVPPGRYITAVASGRDQSNTPGFEYLSEFSFATKVTGNTTPQNTPLRLNAVTPNVGGDNGGATLTIIGEGISQSATVRLRRLGQNDIVGESILVSTAGSSLTARFNLVGKAQGTWDVVVTNPDGTAAILQGAYTIEAGRAASIWTDLLGRTAIRRSQPVRYTVVCGNRGNTDAYGVPLFVTGIPKGAKVTLGFELLPVPLTGPGLPNFSPSQIPAVIQTPSDQMIPLIIPVIPVGTIRSLSFTIEVPANQTNFTLKVFATQPLLEVVNSQSPAQNSSRQAIGADAPGRPPFQLALTQDEQNCLKSILTNATSCAASFIPGSDCVKASINVANLSATVGLLIASPPSGYLTGVLGAAQVISGALSSVWSGAKCFTDASPVGPLLDIVSCALSGASALVDCAPAIVGLPVRIVTALDPNDKVGTSGAGNEHFTTSALPLRYMIYFENQPVATAPAQEVVITDQLDTTRLDLGTFQLGPIAFGNNTVVTPPSGLSAWTTDIDLRPANNLIVRVIAALNKTTGLATWRFISLDPATKQPTTDPLAGFLPPNKIAPEGDGAVVFTIEAKPGQASGTELRNQARIVFDTNAPIDTPTWLNTIDNSKPSSQVAALAATQNTASFPVNWSGTDTGAGVATYTIYVSDNGGPFTVWLNTPATTAVFTGQPGKTYGFYSVATDGAGNREDVSSTADATTIISSAVPGVQFSASNYDVQEDCTTLTITVNRSGDTSGAASVEYSTSDVTATQRRDFITALGKLQFAPGETSKTFAVLINEDSHIEGSETFNLNLTNPSGVSLGGPAIATVTITDDAAEPAANPIDDPRNFVCQNYHDFLNRHPDPSGWDFWTNQITSCGTDPQCIEVRRINVSASFFLSIEFRQTGYLVERTYKTAYGAATGNSTFGAAHSLPVPIVRFYEFLADTQRITKGVIVLQPGWEQLLENNKQDFFAELVQRSSFVTALPTTLTPTEFVDQLNQNAGNVLSSSERTTAINLFSGAGNTTNATARAQALRQVAEDQDLQTAEFNPAFVLMEYVGYVRRNPNDWQDTDHTGYDFWLTKLNQFNGNYLSAEMVKAFITSIEYRQRFGP